MDSSARIAAWRDIWFDRLPDDLQLEILEIALHDMEREAARKIAKWFRNWRAKVCRESWGGHFRRIFALFLIHMVRSGTIPTE